MLFAFVEKVGIFCSLYPHNFRWHSAHPQQDLDQHKRSIKYVIWLSRYGQYPVTLFSTYFSRTQGCQGGEGHRLGRADYRSQF